MSTKGAKIGMNGPKMSLNLLPLGLSRHLLGGSLAAKELLHHVEENGRQETKQKSGAQRQLLSVGWIVSTLSGQHIITFS